MSKKIQTLAGQKFYTVSWTVKMSRDVMAATPREALEIAEDMGNTDAHHVYTEPRAKLMTADEAEKTGKYAADGGDVLFRTEAAKIDAVTEFVTARRSSDGLSDKLRGDKDMSNTRTEQDEKNMGKMYKWLKDRGRPAHSRAINYCAVNSMTFKVITDSQALNLLINHPELFEEVGIGTAIFQAI